MVCLKGQEWRFYCFVERSPFSCQCVYRLGGESSGPVVVGVLQDQARDKQLEGPLPLRPSQDQSGLCILLQLLSGRLCFPDNHCFRHQHVGVLLLGLLDCHGEGLMLVHIIVACDYNPFLNPGL